MAQALSKPIADAPLPTIGGPGMMQLLFLALGRVLRTLGRAGIVAADRD